MKATAHNARKYLTYAKTIGWIEDFDQINTGTGKVQWRVETQPTRKQYFSDRHSHGEIILSSREVMAFIEGCWAGAKVQPDHRAGT